MVNIKDIKNILDKEGYVFRGIAGLTCTDAIEQDYVRNFVRFDYKLMFDKEQDGIIPLVFKMGIWKMADLTIEESGMLGNYILHLVDLARQLNNMNVVFEMPIKSSK